MYNNSTLRITEAFSSGIEIPPSPSILFDRKTYRNATNLDSDNAACIRKRFDFIDVHVKMYAVERLFWRSALENEFQSRNWPKTSGREAEGNAERDFSVDAGKTILYIQVCFCSSRLFKMIRDQVWRKPEEEKSVELLSVKCAHVCKFKFPYSWENINFDYL